MTSKAASIGCEVGRIPWALQFCGSLYCRVNVNSTAGEQRQPPHVCICILIIKFPPAPHMFLLFTLHKTAISVAGTPWPWGILFKQVALLVSTLASSCYLERIEFPKQYFPWYATATSDLYLSLPSPRKLVKQVGWPWSSPVFFLRIIAKAKKRGIKCKCTHCLNMCQRELLLRVSCVIWRQQKQSAV